MITIKDEDEDKQTFYVGKNIYNDDNKEEVEKQKLELTWKDLVAMTLAGYRALLPVFIVLIVLLILVILW